MREQIKRGLALVPGRGSPSGATLLIYHRVGGGTGDELDLPAESFEQQVEALGGHDVVALDEAMDRLDAGERSPAVVLTFDDGFADLHERAWPLLKERAIPFTVYVASSFVGGTMRWEGSTARGPGAPGLTWDQLGEMVASGLCTVGNHTARHARPEALTEQELDDCTADVERELGVTPRHFAYPWGIPVPAMEPALRRRFRTAATGELGRNLPGDDPIRLRRVPVRRTDPLPFFRAKLSGGLGPERTYARLVGTAKRVGLRG